MDALDRLIEAVEAGWAPDVLEHSDAMSAKHIRRVMDAYHGSLDAALALHEVLLPNEPWRICMDRRDTYFCEIYAEGDPEAYAPTPARAWLLAILRAYRSIQP